MDEALAFYRAANAELEDMAGESLSAVTDSLMEEVTKFLVAPVDRSRSGKLRLAILAQSYVRRWHSTDGEECANELLERAAEMIVSDAAADQSLQVPPRPNVAQSSKLGRHRQRASARGEASESHRIAAQILDAWASHDAADGRLIARPRASQPEREASESEVKRQLAIIASLEAKLASCEPQTTSDALVLASLLADRMSAIEPTTVGACWVLHHGQAEQLVRSLVLWLSAETGDAEGVNPMRSYVGNLLKRERSPDVAPASQ